jgi:hypothetical protein
MHAPPERLDASLRAQRSRVVRYGALLCEAIGACCQFLDEAHAFISTAAGRAAVRAKATAVPVADLEAQDVIVPPEHLHKAGV